MTGTGSTVTVPWQALSGSKEEETSDHVRDGGMLHDQWRQENGVWYYFRGWGEALNNGWSKIGNDWYWFNSDCKMASSQWLQQGENWYYLRDWGGRLHSGEFVVDGETYYFNADGVLTDKKELSQVIVIDPGHQGQGGQPKRAGRSWKFCYESQSDLGNHRLCFRAG